jgi:hypothetical protein
MNIAVLICGQWRSGDKCFDNIIKNIINPLLENNNIFIFITTDYTNINNKFICDILNYNDNIDFKKYFNIEDDIFFCKNIEKKLYNKMDVKHHKNYININKNLIFQWHKVNICYKLLEKYELNNNIEFDYIIKTRPDLLINKQIDINIINSNYLYQHSDHFACGPKKYMKIYCDLLHSYCSYEWKQSISDEIIENNFLNVRRLQGCHESISVFNNKKYQWIYCSEIQLLNYIYDKIGKNIKFIDLLFKLIRN